MVTNESCGEGVSGIVASAHHSFECDRRVKLTDDSQQATVTNNGLNNVPPFPSDRREADPVCVLSCPS